MSLRQVAELALQNNGAECRAVIVLTHGCEAITCFLGGLDPAILEMTLPASQGRNRPRGCTRGIS
jgi:hypothetical protein